MTYLTRFTIVLLFSLLFVPMTVGAAGVWSPSASDTYGTSVQSPTLTTGANANSTLTSQSTGVPGSVSGYTPLEPLTAFNGGKYANFADYLGTIYKLAITVGALVAVVMLVTGGVRYMLSESFTDIDKAKKRIINALWGLTILIGSFLILYTINPNLLTFNLALPNVNQSASQFGITSGQKNCSMQCPTGYYCDSTIGYCTVNAYKDTKQNTQACDERGGVWQIDTFSQYCWLNKVSDQSSCTAAGGTWYDPSYVLSPYCYIK